MNMSIINLFVFCMTLFLITFVVNVAEMATEKVDLQNTVDEAAISAATVRARGLNAVTAINHLIGELTAFIVLQDAIGGERLYNRNLTPRPTRNLNIAMFLAKAFAGKVNHKIFRRVLETQGIRADKAVFQSKRSLKERLAWIYIGLGTARIMKKSKFPPTVIAGIIAEAILKLWEFNVGMEHTAITAIERFGRTTVFARRAIQRVAIPILRGLQNQIINETSGIAMQAGEAIGRQNGVKICFDPDDLALPITLDPNAGRDKPFTRIPNLPPLRDRKKGNTKLAKNVRNQIAKTTQLGRATYPWVLHHRKPIMKFTSILWNSRFASHYKTSSWEASVEWVEKLQKSNRFIYGLYVLEQYPAPNKGYSLWNERGADHLFTVTGIGWREAPPQFASVLLGYRPSVSVAISQSMTYNANRQRRMDAMISPLRRPVRFRLQAPIGWDTLNFEGRMSEMVNDPKNEGFPKIKLNWQSKLVPIAADIVDEKIKKTRQAFPRIESHLRKYILDNKSLSIR